MCPVDRRLQLRGQLHPLRLATGQGGCRLAQPDVAQAHVDQGLQMAGDGRYGAKNPSASSHESSSTSAMVLPRKYLESVTVVPGPLAYLARHVDVGEEVHLDPDGPVARARLAPTALDVEREPPGQVAAHLGLVWSG